MCDVLHLLRSSCNEYVHQVFIRLKQRHFIKALHQILLTDVLSLWTACIQTYNNDTWVTHYEFLLECPLVACRMCDICHVSSAVCHQVQLQQSGTVDERRRVNGSRDWDTDQHGRQSEQCDREETTPVSVGQRCGTRCPQNRTEWVWGAMVAR